MKNPFNKIFLQPNFKRGHQITWEIDPTFVEASPWVFTLEVSEVPTFTEVFYTTSGVDLLWLTDVSGIKQNWDFAWYYRVKLTTGEGNTYVSPSIMLGGDNVRKNQYITAAEMIRKEMLIMERYTGRKAWLLKRKIYAEKVKALVDPVSGVPIADSTKEYGTGLKDGYHLPIPILVQNLQSKSSKKLNADGNGVDEYNFKQLRMAGFPLVSPRDIIVLPSTDARYIVQGEPTYTSFPGTDIVVVQTHMCALLPSTDTAYSIAIPKTR